MALLKDTNPTAAPADEPALGQQPLAAGGLGPGLADGGPSPDPTLNEPRPPLGLRTLGLFEAAKGGLAVAAACGVLSLRHTDLHTATDAFLLHHGIDPERHYTRLFIESVARATHSHVGQIAAFCFAYALIRLAEGYGLWHGKRWAKWFAVISAGLYLPFEMVHFARRPSPFNAGVILFNLALILYLGNLMVQQRSRRRAQK